MEKYDGLADVVEKVYTTDNIDLSESTVKYHAGLMGAYLMNGNIDEANASSKILIDAVGYLAKEKCSLTQENINYKMKNEKLEKLATGDSLTTLYNRRYLDKTLDAHVASEKKKFSIIYFDVDHFKKFNDKYGHLAGDYVLKNLGKLIKKNMRETDVSCRYGGEEFAVVLPDTDEKGAYCAAENLRRAVESTNWVYDGKDLGKVTISIGVSEIYNNDNPATLVKRADRALYIAKTKGRNQTVLSTE